MLALKIFMLSFIVAFSGAVMPGPLLTVTVAQSVRRGIIASVLIMAGHALLELLLLLGLLFGLGNLLLGKQVLMVVAVLGGLTLLWMGWGMIRDARRGVLDLQINAPGEKPAVHSSSNLVLAGMVVSLSNPYWLIWWATIGLAGLTAFQAITSNLAVAIPAFYIGHITGDAVWYMAVGAATVSGRRLLSARVYRGVVQACALFLIFLGSSFLYLAITNKLGTINTSLDWMKSLGR